MAPSISLRRTADCSSERPSRDPPEATRTSFSLITGGHKSGHATPAADARIQFRRVASGQTEFSSACPPTECGRNWGTQETVRKIEVGAIQQIEDFCPEL